MESLGIKVLVLEDDRLLNWSLASSLSKWGFEVQAVFAGNDAVREIQQCQFDIFLLDYQVPDLDGLSIARIIRKAQPGAAIFLLTAHPLNELTPDSGLIDIYLNKPFNLQNLHRSIQDIILLRKDGKQLRAQSDQSNNR